MFRDLFRVGREHLRLGFCLPCGLAGPLIYEIVIEIALVTAISILNTNVLALIAQQIGIRAQGLISRTYGTHIAPSRAHGALPVRS